MKLAVLLAAACPVGSNVAVYAQLHGKDYPYAVETVVLSTLFSIFSQLPNITNTMYTLYTGFIFSILHYFIIKLQ